MRLLRRVIGGFVIAVTLVATLAALSLTILESASFKDWLRALIVRESRDYLNGELAIGRLSGTLFSGVELDDVNVRIEGRDAIAIRNVRISYSLGEIVSKGLAIRELRLSQPRIEVRRDGDSWSIAHLVKKERKEADRQGPAKPIAVAALHVTDGTVVFDDPVETSGIVVPRRIDGLDFHGSLQYEPAHYAVDVKRLSLRGSMPAFTLAEASGTVRLREDDLRLERIVIRSQETALTIDGDVSHYLTKPQVAATIVGERFSPPELAALVPALRGVTIRPAFVISARGPTEGLLVDLKAKAQASEVSASVLLAFSRPQTTVSGDVSVVRLDLASVTGRAGLSSDLSANSRVNLRLVTSGDRRSLSGSAHVKGGRIAIGGYAADSVVADVSLGGSSASIRGRVSGYGASTTATTTMDWSGDDAVQYEIQGRALTVNLSKLPAGLGVPPAPTDLNADYRVRVGRDGGLSAEARFLPSTAGGVEIAESSTATLSHDGSHTSYTADLNFSNLNLRQVGRSFDIPEIDATHFESALNGRVIVDAAGTQLKEMRLSASGNLANSTIAGIGVSDLTFTGGLDQDAGMVTASGHVLEVNPAALGASERLKGRIDAAFDLDGSMKGVSLGRDAETVAHVKVNVRPSTIGPIGVDRADFEGTYRGEVADITHLSVDGADIHVDAAGTLSLTDEEPSNLTFHANSADLKTLGDAFGVPVSGIGKIEGTVDGEREQLRITGNVSANDLIYGTSQALTLSADYTARIPDLQIANATVAADTKATFVILGGQEVNELSAKVSYEDRQMRFEAQAKQPERSLSAKGSVRLLPEEQQVRLERLAVQARGHEWQTTPDTTAEVDYGDGAILLRNLSLFSGNQHITAEGAFGRPGDVLNVVFADVDLSNVDAVLLREPQFSGRLNLSGAVTGTREMPAFNGQFRVERGGFRKFAYEELAGSLESNAAGVTLDIRLQQNPSAWITAKGYVPIAAFTPEPEEDRTRSTAHEVASNPMDNFDLEVQTSSIDLGVVQAFTTALTGVQGTVQAHVQIRGTAHDPHPEGEISVANGAATATPLGVKYSGLNGRFALEQDRVRIDNLRIQDNDGNEMVVTGDLAIHERQLGGVNVSMNANGFTVLKNEMGRVHVDSKMQIAGDLIKPRIQGDLAISSGRIELDPLLVALSDSAYAVKPADYSERPASTAIPANPPAEEATPQAGSLFDRLALDVHFKVPDDLVVRGTDLRTAGAPISLGAVNVTLGGDLQAKKESGDPLHLTGTVNTVRGTYDFQGRRFDILRSGTIRFAGLDTLEPTLDVRARRVIQGVEARVDVQGTLKDPHIVLTSVPPLEQADILALIVFNQPVNQLGEGQQASLAQRATALATGAVAGELSTSIGKALNLDTFDIQTATDSSTTVQVTAGQQIGERAFVKVEQGIGDQSQTNLVFDYQFRDWLRLQSNVLMGASIQQSLFNRAQGSGFDILFTFPAVR
jgi:autotransporter translocation and assembly factor TamB